MRIEKVNRTRYITCGMISSTGTGKGKLSSVGSKTVKIGMDKSMFKK
jgi:hypothetical protein